MMLDDNNVRRTLYSVKRFTKNFSFFSEMATGAESCVYLRGIVLTLSQVAGLRGREPFRKGRKSICLDNKYRVGLV